MLVITSKKHKIKFGKTRKRLVLTYLAITVLTLVFIASYILASISQYLYNRNKIEVVTNANVIANMIGSYVKTGHDNIPYVVKQLNLDDQTRVIVTDDKAEVVYDSSLNANISGKILVKEEIISAIKGTDVATTYKEEDVGTVVQGAVSIISNSETIGVVYVSTVAKATDDFIDDIKWILIVISLIVCILIGILSSVMADVIISPVERLTKIIRGMQDDGKLDEKVEVNGNDEVSQLGEAFNTLIDKLNEFEEDRRAFVSNASHELKTPLSSIKLLADSILSMGENVDGEMVCEFMEDINGEIDRLNKIISRLLDLSKLDVRHEKLDLKVTDINEMAHRIVKSLAPVAQSKEINLSVLTTHEILALVDREKFWQVVYNITDNAVKYTPEGGTVQILVYNEGERCRIEISDNGIGIPKDDAEKIFERFYRVDKARARETGGTGLGLAIAKSVVESHGGTVSVDSTLGEGTRFIISIPKRL